MSVVSVGHGKIKSRKKNSCLTLMKIISRQLKIKRLFTTFWDGEIKLEFVSTISKNRYAKMWRGVKKKKRHSSGWKKDWRRNQGKWGSSEICLECLTQERNGKMNFNWQVDRRSAQGWRGGEVLWNWLALIMPVCGKKVSKQETTNSEFRHINK